MTAALLTLVSLILAQPTGTEDAEPTSMPSGVPSAETLLARLPPAPKHLRGFEAVWEEQPTKKRPARMALRVKATRAGELTIETFDMSAPSSRLERYGAETAEGGRPITAAPAWLQWVMGYPPLSIVERLKAATDRRALDVDEGDVLWVLGAQTREVDRPQIRVDRTSGEVRRIIERRGDSLLDMTLYGPERPAERPWLPERLVLRESKETIRLQLQRPLEGDAPKPDARGPRP